MKTAAAYIRVSDDRQDEFSPDSQLKLIREYCKKNEIDLPDELVFYDDGISAKSTKKRVQFNEMIALAKQKEKPFELILVWKFSRFARNQEESIVYKSLLRKNGVEVVSVSEPLSDNPFGGLIERIIEWMDEYYLIRLSDEVRRGMTERATRGKPNVAPPFGYKMVEGQYVIVPEEAAAVVDIYEMFLSGVGMRKISMILQSRGVKNRNGNYIDNRGIEYILNNPCYNGYLRWNPNGRSASARVYDNPDDILVKGSHEKIIDDETFAKVKDLLEERRRANRKYVREDLVPSEYMLRGLVKCNTCGATLVYQKAEQGIQCNNYSHGLCKVSHFIKTAYIDKMVIDELKNAAETLTFNIANAPESKVKSDIDYDKLIASERLKLERAKQAYQNGVDSLDEYRSSKQHIEKEIQRLTEEKMKDLESSGTFNPKEFGKVVTDVIALLESPELPPDAKNQALKTIVQKVVFYKPERRVELHFYI